MSFLNDLAKLASDVLGSVAPQDAAQAASDHVQQMDPNELADHLQQSTGTLDRSQLVALGQHLLQSMAERGSGDPAQVAQQAGTSNEEVGAGAAGAINAVIDYAKSNPQALQAAAQAFMQRNPEAIKQLAPGLLNGILARLQQRPQQ